MCLMILEKYCIIDTLDKKRLTRNEYYSNEIIEGISALK